MSDTPFFYGAYLHRHRIPVIFENLPRSVDCFVKAFRLDHMQAQELRFLINNRPIDNAVFRQHCQSSGRRQKCQAQLHAFELQTARSLAVGRLIFGAVTEQSIIHADISAFHLATEVSVSTPCLTRYVSTSWRSTRGIGTLEGGLERTCSMEDDSHAVVDARQAEKSAPGRGQVRQRMAFVHAATDELGTAVRGGKNETTRGHDSPGRFRTTSEPVPKLPLRMTTT